ncbi:hypothetical protein DA075_15480 [Methylobacterium currus]|uniref:Uncharacterized protein n=1 Tax=Methylobacterium currus TaxID=2051553 RepID=A0A2R4WKS9_9HYPH|nr:hypothetical protein [Methylobacterium currus]AWB22153.1 hypothetical protein DA075_15480 [Methylobacterium currus]
MPEPTVPDTIAAARDPSPPPPILPDPDLRPIDLAASACPDRLDAGAREHLARAGQEALDACLRRLTPVERAAFWRAICVCYNRPYNPGDSLPGGPVPADAMPEETVIPPAEIAPAQSVLDPHVIDAVLSGVGLPGREGTAPDAVLR